MCYHLIIINPFSLLSDVLDANGVIVGDEEFDSVMQKYDVENTGRYAFFTIRPLIVGGLIKKRGFAIFPEEINGEGVNKWKWVNFSCSA